MARVEGGKIEKLARLYHEVFRRMVHDGSLPPEKVFKVFKDLLGNKTVNVGGHSWEELVKACGCDNVYIYDGFDPEKHLPPLPEDQQEDVEAILRKQDKTTTNREWLQILDENPDGKHKFADPRVVIALGAADPDEQRENPLFTIWFDDSGQLWYLLLYVVGGGRYLNVGRGLGGGWDASSRAVAVAK